MLAADPAKEAEFDRALVVGREHAAVLADGDRPSAQLRADWERVDVETLAPIRALLGLATQAFGGMPHQRVLARAPRLTLVLRATRPVGRALDPGCDSQAMGGALRSQGSGREGEAHGQSHRW